MVSRTAGRWWAWLPLCLLVPVSTGPLAAQDLPPIFRDAVPESSDRWVGEPVSMSLKDADLVETLRTFARLGDFNLLIQPGVRGTVTVELKEVPWDQAMSMILRMHGLGMDLSGGTVRIAPPEQLARMLREEAGAPTLADAVRQQLKVKGVLKNLEASQVVRLLQAGYLTDRGRAWAHPRTNALTVKDEATRLRRIARLVARLDAKGGSGEDLDALRRRARELWPGTTAASQAR